MATTLDDVGCSPDLSHPSERNGQMYHFMDNEMVNQMLTCAGEAGGRDKYLCIVTALGRIQG